MKLVVLGANGYRPNDLGQTACYAIPELGITLDAGTGLYRMVDYLQTDQLDIYLSHDHPDHVWGLTCVESIFWRKMTRDAIARDGQADTLSIFGSLAESPPRVRVHLAHGLTGNTTFWRGYGYVDQLRDRFTVILFDARGHGRSDKPHGAATYDHRLMVGDVLAVLDALDINKAHYWAYSMGGAIGLGLAKLHPERLISLIAGGIDPFYSRDETNEPSPMLEIFRRGVTDGTDAVVEGMRALAGSIAPQYEERLRGLDPQAMVAYLEPTRSRPSYVDALPQMNLPCLLYAGERDGNAHKNGPAAARQMLDACFASLPGLNHVGASGAVDLIMPHVLAFLADL